MFQKRAANTFIKAQFSAIVSTIADFLLTLFLTELGIWYLLSSLIGTISGGCINFSLGRYWVFKARNHKKIVQAKRYVIIWIGNLVLNTLGIYVFTDLLKIHYILSKILISVIVGVFYNFYFQKSYVYRTQNEIF
jgi:putative flippase GtrA